MDWYLDAGDLAAATALRREIAGYLRRHATEQHQADDAELAVQELLSNAVEHTHGPVWVSLEWPDLPILRIYDLGEDFDLVVDLPDDPEVEGGRGLFLASHLTKELSKANRRAGGNLVSATLLVDRPDEPTYAPSRRGVGVLPSLDEADPEGFGKVPFLRALVVQLAQALEETHGPRAAQRAVAQVGTDVGAQMEAEYRAARGVVERLSPEQMAECYVRLKAAIDGQFHVISVDEQRIVLGNRACPFGAAVQRSPSLCRMTSSVFGGIAARNAEGATVHLEERIALGDPECRVVVELGPPNPASAPGHRYPAPSPGDALG